MTEARKFMFDLDFSPSRPTAPSTGHGGGGGGLGLSPDEMEAAGRDDSLIGFGSAALEEMKELLDGDTPEPPPPTFSEEDITLARQLSFHEGHEAGWTEASETNEAKIASALAALTESIPEVFARQEQANATHARDAVRVAMTIIKKMFPASYTRFAEDEIAHTVSDVIGQILDEPRIIVRVAPDMETMLKSRLDPVAQDRGFEGRVVVQADGRIPVGDCRVEWTDGGAERDQARLMADIEELVDRALATPESPTQAQARAQNQQGQNQQGPDQQGQNQNAAEPQPRTEGTE